MYRALVAVAVILLALVVRGGLSATPSHACVAGETTGQVRLTPANSPLGVHHKLGLQIVTSNFADAVPGSGRFEIDGPAGHTTVPEQNKAPAGDFDGGAYWTPPNAGHYQVTGHWSMYGCDGAAPFAASAALGVDIVPEQRATDIEISNAYSNWSFHPGTGSRRFTTLYLVLGAKCPSPTVAGPEPLTMTVYYPKTKFSSAPISSDGSSPHITSAPFFCQPYDGRYRPGGVKRHSGRHFQIEVSNGAGFVVHEPTALRVLVELHQGGALIGTRRVTFSPGRPSFSPRRHGEKGTVRPGIGGRPVLNF